jgi:hypothetical protein
MKKLVILLVVCLGAFLTPHVFAQELTEFGKKLKMLPGVEFKIIKPSPGFTEGYEVMVNQLIDHTDKVVGTFQQRVFLQFRDYEASTLIVTEGYAADYAAAQHYAEELTPVLNCNQVVIEHRYFGKSIPKPLKWKYLTVENAAADHHYIIGLLKKLFKGKFVTTGISKGGQTAVYHRTFYPNDVDATVAYVAPFNIAQEDPREIYFLKQVGDNETRSKITAFQQEVLKNRSQILPLLKADVAKTNSTFAMSADSTLDYLVLEFPFSYWQWGITTTMLPKPGESPEKFYKTLSMVVPPASYTHPGMDYFYPFSYQAYTEVGYYGYDTTALGKYLAIKGSYVDNKIMAPKHETYSFKASTLQKVRDFISYKGNNIIYIYGEFDPWTASAAMPTTATNSVRFIKKGGNHGTRISHLEPAQKNEIEQLLSKWLTMPIEIPWN